MAIFDQLFDRRLFPLPHFQPIPLEFEDARDEPAELLLDQMVAHAPPAAAESPPPPVPTAGELHQCIERHLRGEVSGAPRADAADELRNALAELRRSLG